MKKWIALTSVVGSVLLCAQFSMADGSGDKNPPAPPAKPAPVKPAPAPAPAVACPDLTGTYTCKDNQGQSNDAIVQQTTTNGVTLYTFTGGALKGTSRLEMSADGKTHDMVQDGMKNAKYTAVCAAPLLKVALTGTIMQDPNTPFGDLTVEMDMNKNDAKQLQVKSTGKVVGNFGTFPVNSTMVCTLK